IKVIIPLPDHDFDTTEVSIPWKHFVGAGFEVTFSTETGKVAQTDPLQLTGVIFGQLGAKPDAIAAYRELDQQETCFQNRYPKWPAQGFLC
ncbi:MAG TPA: type 1 glutamine amidotransferase domain-containing protein, partial [Ktedonobacteraceae bacterium]